MKYLKVYVEYIFEGKKEFLQSKYKLEEDIFNKLIEADPTKGKYFEWIITRYLKSKEKKVYLEDLYKIKKYLETFEILKKQHKIKETDIGKYLDYKDLYIKMKEIGGTGNICEDETYLISDRYYIKNGEAKLFYEDEDYLIVIPKTLKASKYYASNTEWCTQYPDEFESYSKQGNLYIIIDKKLLNTTDSNKKLQFHFEAQSYKNIDDISLNQETKMKFVTLFKDCNKGWYLNFDYVFDFVDGFAPVELNSKWGCVNSEGEEICNLKYTMVYYFYNNFAPVELNTKYGFINKHGDEICELKYDWVDNFENRFAKVKLNKKSLYIDEQGNEYDEIPKNK
jgi:hypothetical protein